MGRTHSACSLIAMQAQLLLADSAQVLNGKMYVLGGGWNQIGPKPTAMEDLSSLRERPLAPDEVESGR